MKPISYLQSKRKTNAAYDKHTENVHKYKNRIFLKHNNENCKKKNIVLTFAHLNSNYCLLHVDEHVAEFIQTSVTLLLSAARKRRHFHSDSDFKSARKELGSLSTFYLSPKDGILESKHFFFFL